SAALAASSGDARVILIDDQSALGGTLLGASVEIDGAPSDAWLNTVTRTLVTRSNVRLLTRTTATGIYDHNFVLACERLIASHPRQGLWKIRVGKIILASGAFERPLIFPGNDRPGVMLAGAAQTYIERYGVAPGRTSVVATNNDSAYRVGLALHAAG